MYQLAEMSSVTRIVAIFALVTVFHCAADDGLTGLAHPDPEKTCVSIRLPWRKEPIYFCTEKFQHQAPSCGGLLELGHTPSHCGTVHQQNNSLLIATPWDCCPLVSQPIIGEKIDPCKLMRCAPRPIGRTCVDLRTNSTSRIGRILNCCPRWFCEEGIDTETQSCSFKLLEASCKEAPENKHKCIGFHDVFGCCPKFQCEGEGKPGSCPATVVAHHHHNDKNQTALTLSPALINCIGDHTCPDNLKCCGNAGFVFGTNGVLVKSKIIHGFCVEPINNSSE